MLFALGAIGEMTNFFDFGSKTRVGNSLMVFWANCLFFVSKRAKKHSLVKKSELLTSLFSKEWQSLFCKEWRSLCCKEWRVRFAFGHKKGEKLWKTVKNLQNNINFLSKLLIFCERMSDSLVKKSKSLTSLFSVTSAIHLWKRANYSRRSLVWQ